MLNAKDRELRVAKSEQVLTPHRGFRSWDDIGHSATFSHRPWENLSPACPWAPWASGANSILGVLWRVAT